MSRRMGRMLAVSVAAGLALSAGAAVAAPAPMLKQFKVPTARSQPRAITNGSDGNRWFTESDVNNNFAKIARITPAGVITEFSANEPNGCNGCGISDIAQGPGNILYITSNSSTLMRFNVSTLHFETPVVLADTGSFNDLAVGAGNVWITDFNRNVVWRYNIATGATDTFPANTPIDVAVDAAGNAWFTENFNNPDGTSNIGRIGAKANPRSQNPVTRTVIPAPAGSITVTPGPTAKVWFGEAFGPAVGFLDPAANNHVTVFPVTEGPLGIAPAADGSVWFTQNLTGNIANITEAGVITEGKVVKDSGPFGITVADNGNPWYTMQAANNIATLQLR